MTCKYGSTWLTGTPWQEGCGEIVYSASQSVDITTLINGASVFVAGRGNIEERIPLTIDLSFPTPEAALEYCIQLPWLLSNTGVLRFEEGSTVIEFGKAALANVERQRRGTQVSVTYEFAVMGPPIVNPPPPPASITFALNNTVFAGYTFTQWDVASLVPANSLLKKVAVDAILTQAVLNVWASDLSVYANNQNTLPTPSNVQPAGGVLQIGGDTNLLPFGVTTRFDWPTGFSSVIGTPVVGEIDVTAVALNLTNNIIGVGNGYQHQGAWTGTVTLTYQAP